MKSKANLHFPRRRLLLRSSMRSSAPSPTERVPTFEEFNMKEKDEEIDLSVGELFEARRYVSLLSDAQKEQLRKELSEKRFNELFEDEKAT